MSAKDKDKVDDTTSMISDNGGERVLISVITVIEIKKDTFIKIRDLTVFTGDRIKFSVYKTFVGLAVWVDNKKTILNRNMKIVIK
jgi:hypothetical protein